MGDEDDEDDYMTDRVVKECEMAAATSTKGSTGRVSVKSLASAATRRQIAIEKRQERDAAEARRMNPRVRLEEGLATAISEQNVGFRLLAKMGFRPDQGGLGKTQSGRTEPIPLEFRQGRSGLGREAVRSRVAEERDAARQRLVDWRRQGGGSEKQFDEKQFAELQKKRASEQRTRRDLYAARKACLDLDTTRFEIVEPLKEFYWPEHALPKKEQQEEEEEEEEEEEAAFSSSPGEQLEELSAYLRLQHCYCVWCGAVYASQQELETSCPGPGAEFHEDS